MLDTPRIKVAKPRRAHPDKALTAVHVRNIKKPGKYCDGNGLYLVVDPSGAKRWLVVEFKHVVHHAALVSRDHGA